MPILRLALLLLSAALPGCGSKVAATVDDAAAIRAVIATLDSAWNRKDSVAVSAVMAPSYVYFSSRGGVTPRARALETLQAPHYQLEYADRSELEVHQFGGSAVVASRWRGRGTWEGKQFIDDQRCSLVLSRGPDGWLVLSEHCTQIEG
jgi:ketosteroid isomerase-like protein